MAAILDFLKVMKYGLCCIIIHNFHAKNEKDPAHRFRTAHTFPYFSYNYRHNGRHVRFFENLKYGFMLHHNR